MIRRRLLQLSWGFKLDSCFLLCPHVGVLFSHGLRWSSSCHIQVPKGSVGEARQGDKRHAQLPFKKRSLETAIGVSVCAYSSLVRTVVTWLHVAAREVGKCSLYPVVRCLASRSISMENGRNKKSVVNVFEATVSLFLPGWCGLSVTSFSVCRDVMPTTAGLQPL